MPKKKPDADFTPLRDVDNPTAAFPIGTLAGGNSRVDRPAASPPRRRPRFYDPERDEPGDDDADEFIEEEDTTTEMQAAVDVARPHARPRPPAAPPRAHPTPRRAAPDRARAPQPETGRPAALVLSLIGGVALALMLVVLIAMVLLLG